MNYVVPILTVGLATIYLTPLKDLSTFIIQCTLLGAIVIAMAWYGVIGYKEKIHDEREERIRARAHRASYLLGMSGLALIMLYHLLTTGHVYPETIALLAAMSLVKVGVHWYGERNW